MFLPSRRLVVALAVASPLFLVGVWAAAAADLALLVAAAVDGWRTGGPRAPRLARSTPGRIAKGATAEVSIRVTNRAARPRRIAATDDVGRGLTRVGPESAEAALPPGASLLHRYRVVATGRGDVVLGDAHVRVLGPLGLTWRQLRIPVRTTIRIQPGLLEMRRNRLLGTRHRLRLQGLRNVRQRGQGRSFESLRGYVRGDDPRTIDWKATARRGELHVRQYEAERSQSIVLAIDAGRLMTESLGDRERLDHALAVGLLLADVAAAHGDRVGLLAFADRVQRFLPPRRQALAQVGGALATVEARPVESNYPLAFDFLRRKVRRRSLVVVLTDVIDRAASSAMLSAVGRSAERHLVLAVALRNPELVARADAPVDSEAAAYRRAAAEEMLQARATALATLRRSGTLIADVTPDQAVTEAINRYLEAKYRGLI